jgi:hypothetical protein
MQGTIGLCSRTCEHGLPARGSASDSVNPSAHCCVSEEDDICQPQEQAA